MWLKRALINMCIGERWHFVKKAINTVYTAKSRDWLITTLYVYRAKTGVIEKKH